MASRQTDSDRTHTGAHASELVRQARHLRRKLAHRPGEMHKQLSRLSNRRTAQHDSNARLAAGFAPSQPQVSQTNPDVIALATLAFSAAVRKAFKDHGLPKHQAPVLRYSLRLELIRQGEKLGLTRFHANLVIATIEHEWEQKPAQRLVAKPVTPLRLNTSNSKTLRRSYKTLAGLLVLVLTLWLMSRI